MLCMVQCPVPTLDVSLANDALQIFLNSNNYVQTHNKIQIKPFQGPNLEMFQPWH